MKLSDGLRGVRQLAFDTALLIYFVERHPKYFNMMFFIMRRVNAGRITGFVSTVALAEVLVQPFRVSDNMLAQRCETILTNSNSFQTEPITIEIARHAAQLRARYNLRTPDALHIATAIIADCEAFLTNDADLKRVTDI